MRVDLLNPGPMHVVTVSLSRRNLHSLLFKLNGAPEGSACTIVSGNAYVDGEPVHGTVLVVRAEENAGHYTGRAAPGPMHSATEELLKSTSWNEPETAA